MIFGILVFFHVVVCLFLILVVLLQSGKAADLAGAFGGMGSQTTFGPRSAATLLSKATTIAAAVFMITSLALAVMETRRSGSASSVLDRAGSATEKKAPEKKAPAPVNPAAPAPANPAAPAPTSNVPVTPVPTAPEPAKK